MFHARSLLVVDPSVNSCGYSVWSYSTQRLTDYGIIEPGDKEEYDKILHVAETIINIAIESRAKTIYIEKPPSTMYGQKNSSKDKLIARAQSVFKTVSVTYMIAGMALKQNIKVFFVLPVKWETYLGIKKKGFNIKERSVEHAQKVLKLYNVKQINLSSPKKNENIADAINIGYYYFEKGFEEAI